MVLINTVLESTEVFYHRQYDGAKKAQIALAMLKYPSEKYFKNMVRTGMIPNCPINFYNIKKDNTTFGPNVLSLKGKMVR